MTEQSKSMTPTAEALAKMEELVAKATPGGEWRAQLATDSINLTKIYNAEGSTICGSVRAKDAALIEWFHNTAPSLLREQAARVAELEEALRPFAEAVLKSQSTLVAEKTSGERVSASDIRIVTIWMQEEAIPVFNRARAALSPNKPPSEQTETKEGQDNG